MVARKLVTPQRQVFAGTGAGVSVTAGATAGAKGSYATIGTLAFTTSFVGVSLAGSNFTRTYRVDLAINTGAADVIVAEDLYLETPTSAFLQIATFDLPLELPAGAVLKARAASQTSGGAITSVHVEANGLSSGYGPGLRGLKQLGTIAAALTPAATVTTTGQTFTAWTEIVSATTQDVVDLYAQASAAGDTTRTASQVLFEIAIGASGSEIAIGSAVSSNLTAAVSPTVRRIRTGRIPAGTRLSYRVQASASASADTIGLNLWGLAL